MKIFSAAQLKEWDLFSIDEQQISSEALMERAAKACYHWLINNSIVNQPLLVFCGKGNNGGDGLALARMLLENNFSVTTYILELGHTGTDDFQINLQRLHHITTDIHFIQSADFLPVIKKSDLVIDALFGSGLNRPLDGNAWELVNHINNSGAQVISIDIPSGLFSDRSSKGFTAIHASHTLSFQNAKLAFLMPENDLYVGEFHLLDIGLSKNFEETHSSKYESIDLSLIKSLIRPRNKFAHKGSFGHAALIAGSYGMMGAAVLAAKACMYSGIGKLTCYIPSCGYEIMQTSLPEAMCNISGEKYITATGNLDNHDAIGIGPGIGSQHDTTEVLKNIFLTGKGIMVLDADALNMLAADRHLLSLLPKGSVITPHPKEFERLFGNVANDFERLELAIREAAAMKIYIVLKGHYSMIVTPRGKVFFNSTGNAGMAKAGMGDALTGLLTGFLCQHYPLPEAAILAVYIHGYAGDIACEKYSQQAMQASDLLQCIPEAWRSLL